MADKQQGTFAVKAGLAQMLKGGVIMDVTNVEEARIAEEAGAVAVMALERVPADIRRCAHLDVNVAVLLRCSGVSLPLLY
jgi:pyridoxal biosynthesis lyase PdxS